MITKLTPKMATALLALDAADGKVMHYHDFRKASGAKQRSFGSIFERMDRANLVKRDYDKVHMTFAGMRSLDAHRSTS